MAPGAGPAFRLNQQSAIPHRWIATSSSAIPSRIALAGDPRAFRARDGRGDRLRDAPRRARRLRARRARVLRRGRAGRQRDAALQGRRLRVRAGAHAEGRAGAGAANIARAPGRGRPRRQHRRRGARRATSPRTWALTLAGKRILLLGAGGAARGVIAPLLGARPRDARHREPDGGARAELARRFRDAGVVEGVGLDAMGGGFRSRGERHVHVDARASGLRCPTACFARRRARLRHGLRARGAARSSTRARAAGARASDGLGMLVEQAAESFFLWRGKRPETASVIAARRAAA